ncbi:hypothetical protein [Rhizobium sp. GN54]|uniref:hypothetical protein n=1 Tax=Rhizobium sp. GN54 TaxID=2898150 RepID=UPI001E4A22FD|nr:hypothetical protein [Rhizobium sp. GN54]MCD2184741.1 hypothetical protein [Rhizobium sp. GN54]
MVVLFATLALLLLILLLRAPLLLLVLPLVGPFLLLISHHNTPHLWECLASARTEETSGDRLCSDFSAA